MDSGQGRPGGPEPADERGGTAGQPPSAPQRRFAASRLRPRVEIGAPRSRPPAGPSAPAPGGLPAGGEGRDPRGTAFEGPRETDVAEVEDPGGSAFGAPREFAGGRVRVYGCSPGCLLLSLAVSLVLTFLLNALL